MARKQKHEDPSNVMTSLCFETLESNTPNTGNMVSRNPDIRMTPESTLTLSGWWAKGVWVPFVVALVLFLVFVQILPHQDATVPHLGFLGQYNPRLRQDVMYPVSPSTIDFGTMCLFFTGCWCLCAGTHEFYFTTSRTSFYRFLTLSLAFGETMLLTNAITDFIKFRIGALRPDFLHRCFGSLVTLNLDELPLSLDRGLASCPMNDVQEEMILEGLVSFPSGHTSMAISCGLFLTYYLLWCLYFLKSKPEKERRVCPVVHQGLFILALMPMLLGLGVAMSRLTDFRHHFVDVLMGIFLGLVFATLVFVRTIQGLDY